MKSLSPRRQALLKKLVSEARAGGAEVRIWITTLHPVVVERLEERTRYRDLLEATRRYLKELAGRYGIAVFDFSTPEPFGGSLVGWYDGAHLDEGNVALLTQRLTKGLP
jgi:lysophospholipase L1-like esterase